MSKSTEWEWPDTANGRVARAAAKALRECGVQFPNATAEIVARAVIAELGLEHYCRECGGWGPKDN